MQALLRLSRAIDWLSTRVGQATTWLVLVAVLISSGNAVIRKAFDLSSNAWLEVQWYLFSAVFLLCAAYTLLRNEHVRIDVILHRFSKRTQIGVDVFGLIVFLLPAAALIGYLSWPLLTKAFISKEMSENAGGLIRWPVYALVPIGFALLWLQGVSELIKRIAFLQGLIDDPTRRAQEKTTEEELAELIRLEAEKNAGQGDRK